MDLRVFQVDSFTDRLFEGNPAGVVLNADGLGEETMLKIARELNNSETAFIFSSESPDYDIEVRFFTPTREVPICGHATIAAHYVYALKHGLRDRVVRQKTKAGILPVEIVAEEGGLRMVMTQAAVEFGPVIDGRDLADLLAGLGLGEGDLEPGLPVQVVSTGHSKVLVPIKTKPILDSLAAKGDLLASLSARIACNGYYAFTFDSREAGILASGRMFAPAIGIAEDPVTGNANGPLGAYLTRHGRIP
ncbi:MAG: PhzF family phenazine biosynthesis isomerase, partial [Spirochaetaceae bacterium]|nr:PhzF family phenazine biosynthesis isomerase [Spirochaetaceae bacterium]